MQTARTVVKVAGKTRAKQIIHAAKTAKKVNNVYDDVTNPIYFVELTNEHFPQYIPYRQLISLTLSSFPETTILYNIYDKMSVSKDVCEGAVYVTTKASYILNQSCVKTKTIYIIKVYLLLYRLVWILLACVGVHKSTLGITSVLDYMNLIVGNLL